MDEVVLTIDVDWAPDFAIDFVADHLISRRVRATWFVTHMSPAIARLQTYPEFFELGIHPNFLPRSTHGDTPDAVVCHCRSLLPQACSMRTHSLVQSTPLLRQIAAQTLITTDVSLFLPYTPNLRPVEFQWRTGSLLRIPYFWADDFEMERRLPRWQLEPLLTIGPGLKIFAFHPIHVYLNSADIQVYQVLKEKIPSLPEANPDDLRTYAQAGEGTCSLFKALLGHLAGDGQSSSIQDISHQWRQQKESSDDCQ
jgi:hypothetical protein